MRRLLSILLVSAFLFNGFGYYLTYRIIEKGYKKHFRQHIKFNSTTENTEVLVISDTEIQSKNSPFKWMEEDEFRYHGKMYDIIKSEKQGNNNIFYCVNDKNEELLLSRFENYLKHHEDTNTPYQQKSHRILVQIIKEAIPEHPNIFLFSEDISNRNFCYFFSVQTTVINNIFIPPKFF